MGRWLLAIGFFLASVTVAVILLARAGVVPLDRALARQLDTWPVIGPYVATYELGLKESEALARARSELARQEEQIREREAALVQREKELEAARQALRRQERELARREAALSQAEAARAEARARAERLARVAELYAEMRPEAAAERLRLLDDALAASVLTGLPQETAAGILEALPPEESARLAGLLVGGTGPVAARPTPPAGSGAAPSGVPGASVPPVSPGGRMEE